jgi:hypothetical protein
MIKKELRQERNRDLAALKKNWQVEGVTPAEICEYPCTQAKLNNNVNQHNRSKFVNILRTRHFWDQGEDFEVEPHNVHLT